jgi:hypothetical protein
MRARAEDFFGGGMVFSYFNFFGAGYRREA